MRTGSRADAATSTSGSWARPGWLAASCGRRSPSGISLSAICACSPRSGRPARRFRGRKPRLSLKTRRPPTTRASMWSSSRLERTRQATGTRCCCRRRDCDRQLVRVADGSGRAARCRRGQPVRPQRDSEGDHREPELHDDGGDARPQAAARRRRTTSADREHVPGGVRAGVAGVQELESQVREAGVDSTALLRDGAAVRFAEPKKWPSRSPSMSWR